MSKVEEVARALFDEIKKQEQWIQFADTPDLSAVQIDGWVNLIAAATAAIAAMREPSEAMLRAADINSHYPKRACQAIIDAALQE